MLVLPCDVARISTLLINNRGYRNLECPVTNNCIQNRECVGQIFKLFSNCQPLDKMVYVHTNDFLQQNLSNSSALFD